MRFTLKEVADFCWKNKGRNGFGKHGYDETCKHIIWASERDTLIIVKDEQGICGACTFSLLECPDRIYIHQIVAVRQGFPTLILKLFRDFPNRDVLGYRRSKVVTFSKKKLCQILIRHLNPTSLQDLTLPQVQETPIQ